MKASMYLNYTSRSLIRGGQRTVLAIFCVAVGVMAIVALQLVGLMINNAFNGNVRDVNGGDLAVRSQNQPFTQDDLTFFDQLKKDGVILDYTPLINFQGSTSLNASLRQSFTVRVVDPAHYPIVTPPTFVNPKNGLVGDLVKSRQVIVTQPFVDQYKKKIGDTFDIRVSGRNQQASTIPVKLVGVVSETGVFAQAGSVVLLSNKDYESATGRKVLYDAVNVTTQNQSKTDQAVKQIQGHFPVATTQTAMDALKAQQDTIDNIRKFLEVSGLLALLIGGVGIVNTMQVLLSRRKTEIAMLKTTGYRRSDLYLLFGMEASLLGLVGGVLGAIAAVGVSYLVRNLVEQTFGLNIPFVLDWITIGGGAIIGLVTALIFGLLPIVQAANIRPLNVIRDLPEGRGASSIALTIGLLLLLSVLFCGLAIFILNNDIFLGVVSVYGTFIFLGLLSLFFGLVVFIVSKFPVPERFNLVYLAFVLVALAGAALLFRTNPTVSVLIASLALLALIVMLVPRTWKAVTKMALRNLGRQRTRTTTTMLALFVGIFTIGLILVLGQNLRDQVNRVISTTLNYNVISITSNNDTTKLQEKLGSLPGLASYQRRMLAGTAPVAINKKPIQTLLPTGDKANPSGNSLGRGGALYFLSGVEGYDVGNNQLPSKQNYRIIAGRNLQASDAGTDNVLISSQLANLDPLRLKVGDTITLAGIDHISTRTVTVVGVYRANSVGVNLYPLLGTFDTVKALSPAGIYQSIFYMKVDPNKLSKAVDVIGNAVPNAFVLNLANLTDFINQLLNDILLTLTTIASLSLLAGIIIIANAVALAMLERRRELGILKSVGYTRSSLLSEVLIENGLVGGLGALLAVLLVVLATSLLGTYVFRSSFVVSSYIAIALIAGSALLAMLTAALVAWGSVRVRPLEVLRYE